MVYRPHIKILAIYFLCFLAVVAEVKATTVSYVDKLNREVTVEAPVSKAVLFLTYELIPALDCWEKVVGVGRWAYENDLLLAANPNIKKIPSVGTGADINLEALVNLKPDVTITWTFRPEAIQLIEKMGIKVIAIYPESIKELYDVIKLHGRLLGREALSIEIINEMESVFRYIITKTKALKKKRVLWLGSRPTSVAGKIGITNEIFSMINAHNVANEINERNRDVSIERIIGWNPEVIFIWGNAKYSSKDIIKDVRLKNVTAIKAGQVFKAPDWSTWSPRLAPISLWMAKRVYPEAFQDLDSDEFFKRYFDKVFHVKYENLRQINE